MIGDWFSGFGDMYGYGAQQQNPNWNGGALHNQMANSQNAYNSQYNQSLSAYLQSSVHAPVTPAPQTKGDCEGCGAPLKAYIHHCEYCRRAAC